MSGTDKAYRGNDVAHALVSACRLCYAMSGTNIAHAAVPAYGRATQHFVLTQRVLVPSVGARQVENVFHPAARRAGRGAMLPFLEAVLIFTGVVLPLLEALLMFSDAFRSEYRRALHAIMRSIARFAGIHP
eukprot:3941989-Rhodomonas_salina.4